jgi:hypothetical protein
MAGHNDDGGYSHFHKGGTKSPHQGKLVEGIGEKRAPNSGPGGMGEGPKGRMPPPGKPQPMQRKVPGGSVSETEGHEL